MSEVKMTDDLAHQDFDAVSMQTERRIGLSVEEAAAPVVLSAEDLAFVAGGRKKNEYEGQH
jgi:hypothetical protein